MPIGSPQRGDIELNRVYRRAEFAERQPKWSSPLPSIEVLGEGSIAIYVSNLPRRVDDQLYTAPIENTLADIQSKMTLLTDNKGNPKKFKAGFHDACMCSIWIAFVWCEDSTEPPIVRDSCLLDHELVWRQDNFRTIEC